MVFFTGDSMSDRNTVAKSLSVLTGLFVSYYSKNNVEIVYEGEDLKLSTDEMNAAVDWLRTSIIKKPVNSPILEGSSVLDVLVSENTYFYMRVFRPHTLIMGPFFMKQRDKITILSQSNGIIRTVLESCPILDLKYIRAVETFASICVSAEQEQERIVRPEDRSPSTEAEALFVNRMGNDSITARYKADRTLRKYIALGDRSQVLSLLSSLDNERLLDSDRPLTSVREQKNYLMSLNTICRLAAESAGLSDIQIHTISHAFNRKIEKAKTDEDLRSLTRELACTYCDAVAENARNSNSYAIMKIRKHLVENLNENYSLEELAEMVDLNPSYLSRLFRKECGMTITQFIKNQKIREAKWLLENSQMPIVEISESLGFEYNSYFSKVFMKETGFTPSEYRRKFGHEEPSS